MNDVKSRMEWTNQNPRLWNVICESEDEPNLKEVTETASSLLNNSLYSALLRFLYKSAYLPQIETAIKLMLINTMVRNWNSQIIENALAEICRTLDRYNYGEFEKVCPNIAVRRLDGRYEGK